MLKALAKGGWKASIESVEGLIFRKGEHHSGPASPNFIMIRDPPKIETYPPQCFEKGRWLKALAKPFESLEGLNLGKRGTN